MSTTQAIRYPKDLQINSETDYIKFEFHTYKPPFRRDDSSGYLQGGEGNLGTHITEDDVLMYMPQDVSTSMSTSWGGKEITNAAAGMLAGYANLSEGDMGGVMSNIASGKKGIGALPTTAASQIVRMGLNATGAQENLTQNDILGSTAGIILNPNVELLFGGPSLRNIGFRFKMAARSKKEAQDMLRICRRFQFHAHARSGGKSNITASLLGGLFGESETPDFNQADRAAGVAVPNTTTTTGLNTEQIAKLSNSNNFISVPNLCLFKYMIGSEKNPYINQYKACALTNVDVNFTPDGSYSTLIGGYPTSLELSITLVETKIIYQSQIDKGLGVSN